MAKRETSDELRKDCRNQGLNMGGDKKTLAARLAAEEVVAPDVTDVEEPAKEPEAPAAEAD